MKKIIKLLLCTLIFSMVCTQLILFIADHTGLTLLRHKNGDSADNHIENLIAVHPAAPAGA